MKPVLVDVISNVSDVTYISYVHSIITHFPADCNCKSSCLEIAVQPGKFGLFQFLRHIRIDVQRGGNVRMAQGILDHFDIHARYQMFSYCCVDENTPGRKLSGVFIVR